MTPDEIKKALECCVNQHTSCRECPLHYFSASCIIDLKTQALDYINELEVENSKHIKAIDELTEINIGHEEAVRKAKQACLLCHKRQKKRIKELESEVESITGKFDCQQQVYADLSKIIKTQKTEIEALTMENKQLKSDLQLLKDDYEYVKDNLDEIVERDKQLILKLRLKLAKAYSEQKTIKSEAIKEFAERVKEESFECDVSSGYGRSCYEDVVTVNSIDVLAKEMVGENK